MIPRCGQMGEQVRAKAKPAVKRFLPPSKNDEKSSHYHDFTNEQVGAHFYRASGHGECAI
jgi:hypothetical protein